MTTTNADLSSTAKSAIERYHQRVHELDSAIREDLLQSQWLSRARLFLALPGLGLLLFWFFEPKAPFGTWQIGLLLILGFLVIATWEENLRWSIDLLKLRRSAFLRLLARCDRNWKELNALEPEVECNAFVTELTRDIDIFGDRSLYRWASLATTTTGAKTICRWLSHDATVDELNARQEAIRELVSETEWREHFLRLTFGYRLGTTNPESMTHWGESEQFLAKRPSLWIASYVGPLLFLAGLPVMFFGNFLEQSIVPPIGFVISAVGCAINLLITIGFVGRVHDIFVSIGGANRELQSLYALIEAIEGLQPKSALLVETRSTCDRGSGSATAAMKKLKRIMAFAGLQRNPLFFIPYLLLHLMVLWDFRVLEQLEKWKSIYGMRCRNWMDAIGILEALTSAATIGEEYPHWTYPVWASPDTIKSNLEGNIIAIQGLAHPLLSDAARVPNDCFVDSDSPLLLVTGSNMAGKSTMLRSMGINFALARLGAPVCASSWETPNCTLASSIRVQDSLQDGVSFFMAELHRLRSIVEKARSMRDSSTKPEQPTMLVLLDEILQGTNSRERQIAVENVLGQLLDLDCIVLASTHDLELADSESIKRRAQIVHFREYFDVVDGKEVMKFDYRMRPGVTPTTNALKLLELVGLSNPNVG